MHETSKIEKALKAEAERLSAQHRNAPVVIIVGGSDEAKIERTMTATSFNHSDGRLRDLLGMLQTAIQIETWKHFGLFSRVKKTGD